MVVLVVLVVPEELEVDQVVPEAQGEVLGEQVVRGVREVDLEEAWGGKVGAPLVVESDKATRSRSQKTSAGGFFAAADKLPASPTSSYLPAGW